MASNNQDNAPPSPNNSSTYDDHKTHSVYGLIEKQKQGMAVFFTLSPSDKEAILKIGEDKIISADGLANVLAKLDQLYLEDETFQKFKSLDEFESFHGPSDMPTNDYIIKFEKKYHTLKLYGTTISEDLLAFRPLKLANLLVKFQKLAKGTSALLYTNTKDQLKRFLSQSTSFLPAGITPQGNSFPKVEDINYANVPGVTSDDQFAFYSCNIPYCGRFPFP